MKSLDRVADLLAKITGYVSAWVVVVMMLLILFEVFMRYVIHRPPMVADEFSAYMLVAMSYVGMAYAWQQGGHPRITVFIYKLSTKVTNLVRLIGLILALAFSVMMAQVSFAMVQYSFVRNQRASTLFITPLGWVRLPILIGFAILAFYLILEVLRAVVKIRSGQPIEVTKTEVVG